MPYRDYIYTQETVTTRLVWGSLRLAPIIIIHNNLKYASYTLYASIYVTYEMETKN